MSDIACRIEEFQSLVHPLVGLSVSLPWKGYGSAIFFELGELVSLQSPRDHYNQGEGSIAIEWDWRVETGAKVLYGSSNSRPRIVSGIAGLRGSMIESISLVGQVPELVVRFSNGHCLRSMAMVTGDPEWSVKIPDGGWVYAKGGRLLIGLGVSGLTEEEKADFALAERIAGRWGTPVPEPKGGPCAKCTFFVRLDGYGYLHEYGACVAEAGPFDGRIVKVNSGCPLFNDAAPA